MSDIDTAEFRDWMRVRSCAWHPSVAEGMAMLCDEIDALRAELEGERLARIDAENGKRIANEYADAAEAKVAAVEALCDKATNTPGYNAWLPAFVKRVRAAISGPVDDARTTVQEVGSAPTNGALNVPIPHDDAEREL